MSASEIDNIRQMYFVAWQKSLQSEPLSDMENLIVDVIIRHPEYHSFFANTKNFESLKKKSFALVENPFFHLGLHLALLEQIAIDKPPGIKAIYSQLLTQYGDSTLVEHKMLPCLLDAFDHQNMSCYLHALKKVT